MKLTKILGGLILSTIMGVGIAAGVSVNSKSAQEANAASKSTGIFLKGDFNGWVGNDNTKMYYAGQALHNAYTYYLNFTTTADYNGFKVHDTEHGNKDMWINNLGSSAQNLAELAANGNIQLRGTGTAGKSFVLTYCYQNDSNTWIENVVSADSWLTLTKKYSINGSDAGSAGSNQSLAFGASLSGITDPTAKTGYTFGGWYWDVDCNSGSAVDPSGVADGFSTSSGQTATVYAKMVANSYTITYKDQGGDTFSGTHEAGYPTSHTYGTATNLKGASKTGYTFNGWFTDSGCTGTAVTSLGATAYTSAITLYAKWTAKPVVTKYAVYNGTVDTQNPLGSDTVDSGSTYNVPDSIYKPGYTFNGWYTDTACTTKYTARAITSDTSLYAKYQSGTWSSQVQVDLRSSGFDSDAHNYAVYFYDDVTYPQDVYGWSSYVRVNAGNCRVIIPYTLQFAPVGMVFMVYDKDYSQSSWESDPWNTSVDFHSANLNYVSSPFLAVSDKKDNTWTVAVEPDSYPTVQGRKTPEGQWGKDIYYEIRSSRPTAEGHYQYFSQYIELTAGSEFKIVHVGSYYGFSEIVSVHELLEGVFSVGSENDNIACSASGTYKFYFDSKTHAIEITTEALERIDKWATILVGTDDEPRVCDNTMHYWGSAKSEYESYYFPDEARALCLAEEHVGPNDPVTTLLAKAIQRYDHVLRVYGVYDEDTNPDGYIDYIGRVAAGKLSLSHPISILGGFDNNNATPIIVIVIVSLVAVTTIGGYFYLRHKKEQ